MRLARTLVVYAMCVAPVACVDAHLAAEDAARHDAAARGVDPASAPDGAGLGPATADAGGTDARTLPPSPGCPLADGHSMPLTDPCVYVSMNGAPCESGSPGCAGYRNEIGGGQPRSVCNAECRRSDTSLSFVWSVACGSCRRTCAWPDPETPTYEIAVDDCAQRAPTACREGPVTAQEQVDSMLGGLVVDAALNLFELKEDHLVVHFADGCPTAFHGHFHGGLTMLAPQLRELLRDVRWECAKPIECAQVMGPSTLP